MRTKTKIIASTRGVVSLVSIVALTLCVPFHASAQIQGDFPPQEPVFKTWINVIYGPASGKRDETYQNWVKRSSQIPHFVKWANAHFPLPASTQKLDVYVGRCRNPRDNASFGRGNVIRICNGFVYDAVDKYMKQENLKVLDAGHATEGMMYFSFFHELGHAIEAIYDLPVLGNAESSADQFAALTLGQHPELYKSVTAAMNYFWDNRNSNHTDDSPYNWDEHPMHVERISEMACFLFQTDAVRFAVFAQKYGLRGDAESSCQTRYTRALRSWKRVLTQLRVRISEKQDRLFD